MRAESLADFCVDRIVTIRQYETDRYFEKIETATLVAKFTRRRISLDGHYDLAIESRFS